MMAPETWDGTANLSAYAGVEALENYASAAEIQAYRVERLGLYDCQVEFVRRLAAPATGLRVVDVGSGSSAFLYALERAGSWPTASASRSRRVDTRLRSARGRTERSRA
jgi:hypothetical protein